jgi:ribonuclease E
MPIRMLIDASHREETRVAVVHGNRVEEFDFESATRKQLKGNIYLAKVTRVEPSLQAAFVEYGGNRHGFLAFSEIHPDYYQIPIADRQALLAQDAEEHREYDDMDSSQSADDEGEQTEGEDQAENGDDDHDDHDNHDDHGIESLEHDDEITEKIRNRPRLIKRHYKIQEVIKRRQILLVQVVKEERGNKGAALTTYLSLAGRYCVLMPNTLHGGGVSRKIANPADRKKLKSVLSELKMVEGMACIIRTAGLSRTKAEIKRDFDYLTRLWEGIRSLTLQSIAPAAIHEEGDLIKRSIRDLYSRDIDEILVEGEEGYKAARQFMRLLMPSHAKKVQHYQDRIPLFHKFQVEGQLDSMFSPEVRLKSGGYIVINPTEALVAIDVNSGKATREHHIEETAYKTNLEAAEEVARQLRLRDMAGLIVIDFIDMEDRNNIRLVERKLKDCLKNDRARIQIGRISPFGLMEMSRQRLHPGMLEASTHTCPVCDGTGSVRSIESSALHALRTIEEEGIRARSSAIHVSMAPDIAIYLLNKKRTEINDMERRYGFRIEILARNSLIAPAVEIDRDGTGPDSELAAEYTKINGWTENTVFAHEADEEEDAADEEEADELEGETEAEDVTPAVPRPQAVEPREGEDRPRKRRRRRRKRPAGADGQEFQAGAAQATGEAAAEDVEGQDGQAVAEDANQAAAGAEAGHGAAGDSADEAGRKRRRRGRRGGRRRSRTPGEGQEGLSAEGHETSTGEDGGQESQEAGQPAEEAAHEASSQNEPAAEAVKARPRRRPAKAAAKTDGAEAEAVSANVAAVEAVVVEADAAEKPAKKPASRRKKAVAEPVVETVAAPIEAASEAEVTKPKAGGRKPRAKKADAQLEVAAAEVLAEAPAPKAKKPAKRQAALKKAVDPVVKEEAASAPASENSASDSEVDTGPRKRGWWQKTFGN